MAKPNRPFDYIGSGMDDSLMNYTMSPTMDSLMSPYQFQMDEFTYNTFNPVRPMQGPPNYGFMSASPEPTDAISNFYNRRRPPQPIVSANLQALMNQSGPMQGPPEFIGPPQSNVMIQPTLEQLTNPLGGNARGISNVQPVLDPLPNLDPQTNVQPIDFVSDSDRTEFVDTSDGSVPKAWMEPADTTMEGTKLTGPAVDVNISRDEAMPENQGKNTTNNLPKLDFRKDLSLDPTKMKEVPGYEWFNEGLQDIASGDIGKSAMGIDMSGIDFVETSGAVSPDGVIKQSAFENLKGRAAMGLHNINQSLESVGGASNVLQGAMMAGGNIMAAGQFGDAIGDVEEGLNQIPGMVSQAFQDSQTAVDDSRNVLMSTIDSGSVSTNTTLQRQLDSMSNPKNTVGNFRKLSNDVRRNLDKSLDNIVADANKRFESDVNKIDERRRASLDAIEDTRQQLQDAKEELEKEKKQAIVGAAVGVGSIFADTIVPGSGQVLRTGYSAYQSRT
jgi:hypothetical protein